MMAGMLMWLGCGIAEGTEVGTDPEVEGAEGWREVSNDVDGCGDESEDVAG